MTLKNINSALSKEHDIRLALQFDLISEYSQKGGVRLE